MTSEEASVEAVVIGEQRPDSGARDASPGRNPMWSKAPLVLRRFPAILLAVVASALILAVSSAAGPLFLSSAGSASLEDGLARTNPFAAGLSVVVHGPIEQGALAERTRLLSERTGEVRGLAAPVVTVIGSVGVMLPELELPPGAGGDEVRLVSRTAALEHVERLRSVPGDGVWISSATARVLNVEPGDDVSLFVREQSISARVVGVYRTFQFGANLPVEQAEFWNPLSTFIGNIQSSDSLPPPFVLGSEETMVELMEELQDSGQFRWDVPLRRHRMSLGEGRTVASGILGIRADLDDQTFGESVLENIELPARLVGEETRERFEPLLEEFGLADLAERLPSEISIGEQQRVAVARALLLSPVVLLADEPTGHQDADMAERVMSRLRMSAAHGTACLVATHSPEAVAFADRVVGIRDGRVPATHADIVRP